MKNTKLLIIALLSISLISMELIWTRIFSAEYFYTFAFMILSLAVSGLGFGGLALRLFPRLNKESNNGIFLLLTGFMMIIGPALVFQLGLDFTLLFKSWAMAGIFLLTVLILISSFFFGGMALAQLFRLYNSEMPRLYMADLAGAGIGVLFAVVLMNTISTPHAAFISAVPVLLASIIAFRQLLKIIPVFLIAAAVILSNYAADLLKTDRKERIPVIYEYWDANAKLKMGTYGEDDLYRNINIDNVANTPVAKFDGNWDMPDSAKLWFDINVEYLINKFPSCTFLSIGSGGGQDVMQALQYGAEEIHAVEVIPHINYLMTEGQLAEYTGGIYKDPRVTAATDDARAYIRRFENKFDVMYSLSSNTWAALASGSFALAENYLFTKEAFEDYWHALSDSGFLMMEHQFYIPRVVSEVKDALTDLGINNVNDHFAVYHMPKKRRHILLFSKKPMNDEIRQNAFAPVPSNYPNYKIQLFPAADSLKDNQINRIVLNGWQAEADSARIDISPCTDNKPFIAQLGLWKNLNSSKLDKVSPYAEFGGFPLSKLNIVIILIIVIAVMVPLNFLPYFFKGDKLKTAPWLYFFAIGMAFMMVEIVLIQKYTLLIGSTVYSLITILLSLLLASGIGSRFAKQVKAEAAFSMIIGWLVLDAVVFKELIYLADGFGLFGRIFMTILLTAPLGFFMGMPFPKGSLKAGELVDWGFAVNGTASVLGSTLVILIAFTFGYSIALLLAAVLYGIAYFLFSKTAW